MFSEISYNTKFKLLFPLFRDRLEDMRFMYETLAETAGHISFDSVDPFYDSLPWFRLIGRYVSTLKVDHDLSLLFLALCTCRSTSISRKAHVLFSRPLILLHFTPLPLPALAPLSHSLHLLHFFVISSSAASCRTPFHPAVCTGRSFPCPLHSSLTICTVCAFLLQNFKFCYFGLVFVLFFNCCGYYFFLFFALKLNWLPKWNS